MTREQAAEYLELIVKTAPKLRAAGVLSVSVGEASFALAAHEAEPDAMPFQDEEPDQDILDDHWTYGRTKPRATREKRKQ